MTRRKCMKKRLLSITMTMAIMLALCSNTGVFAQTITNQTDSDANSEYSVLAVDKIPVREGIAPRAATLVGSDVIHYYSGFGLYSYAWGYTDVRNSDNSNAYHYTRAEVQYNGTTKVSSGNIYGYGYVEAESPDCENGMKSGHVARIFWGTN